MWVLYTYLVVRLRLFFHFYSFHWNVDFFFYHRLLFRCECLCYVRAYVCVLAFFLSFFLCYSVHVNSFSVDFLVIIVVSLSLCVYVCIVWCCRWSSTAATELKEKRPTEIEKRWKSKTTQQTNQKKTKIDICSIVCMF